MHNLLLYTLYVCQIIARGLSLNQGERRQPALRHLGLAPVRLVDREHFVNRAFDKRLKVYLSSLYQITPLAEVIQREHSPEILTRPGQCAESRYRFSPQKSLFQKETRNA